MHRMSQASSQRRYIQFNLNRATEEIETCKQKQDMETMNATKSAGRALTPRKVPDRVFLPKPTTTTRLKSTDVRPQATRLIAPPRHLETVSARPQPDEQVNRLGPADRRQP